MARYIDADALRTALELERIGTDFFCGYGFKRAIWHIKHTPTANVDEVKHGKWETIPDYSQALISYRHICSECKIVYKDIRSYGHNYCPNCGAKMDGKE